MTHKLRRPQPPLRRVTALDQQPNGPAIDQHAVLVIEEEHPLQVRLRRGPGVPTVRGRLITLGMTIEAFAHRVGVAARTVDNWAAHPQVVPAPGSRPPWTGCWPPPPRASGSRWPPLNSAPRHRPMT
jgi:hypothetical protein